MGRIVDGIDAVAAKTLPFTDRLGLVTGIDALYDDAVLVEGEQHVGDIILVGILVDVSLVHTGTPFAKERLRRGWYGCDGAVVVRARGHGGHCEAADDHGEYQWSDGGVHPHKVLFHCKCNFGVNNFFSQKSPSGRWCRDCRRRCSCRYLRANPACAASSRDRGRDRYRWAIRWHSL